MPYIFVDAKLLKIDLRSYYVKLIEGDKNMNKFLDPNTKALTSDEETVEILEIIENVEDYSDLDDSSTAYEFDYEENY